MKIRQPDASCLLVDSPMGWLRLKATDQGLVSLDWVGARNVADLEGVPGARAVLRQAARWLGSYFERRVVPPLPPLLLVGTDFQTAVWRRLAALPAGQLTTYGEIARALGNPGAGRAVGQAVGANPLPIFIPCHRVLAAGGRLGGYSSGLPRKRWLLTHEGLVVWGAGQLGWPRTITGRNGNPRRVSISGE